MEVTKRGCGIYWASCDWTYCWRQLNEGVEISLFRVSGRTGEEEWGNVTENGWNEVWVEEGDWGG